MKRLAPGDVSSHSASAFRVRKDTREPELLHLLRCSSETTAVTTRRSIARGKDVVKSVVLGLFAPLRAGGATHVHQRNEGYYTTQCSACQTLLIQSDQGSVKFAVFAVTTP